MQVAIALYPRLTALDAVGPYEVLQRVPSIDVIFVGERRGEVRTENGMLGLTVDAESAQVPAPDVVLVPGGIGTRDVLAGPLVDWLRDVHRDTRFTTSVCSGSLVLGAAGLLDGLTATTHWSVLDYLATFGAVPVTQRFVEHRPQRLITAAGSPRASTWRSGSSSCWSTTWARRRPRCSSSTTPARRSTPVIRAGSAPR